GGGDLSSRWSGKRCQAADGPILPRRHHSALCEVGSAGGGEMSAYRLGEFHAFQGGGQEYLYLVPSGAIFALDELSSAIINRLRCGERTAEELEADLAPQGFSAADLAEAVA